MPPFLQNPDGFLIVLVSMSRSRLPRLVGLALARLDFERTLGLALLPVAHEVREELCLLQQELEPLLRTGRR